MVINIMVEVGNFCMYFGFVQLKEMQSWDLFFFGGRFNIVKDVIFIDSFLDRIDVQVGFQIRKQQGVDVKLIFRVRDKFRSKKGEISFYVVLIVYRKDFMRL